MNPTTEDIRNAVGCVTCDTPLVQLGRTPKKYCSTHCKNKASYAKHKVEYAKRQGIRYRSQSTEERIFKGARDRARRAGLPFTIELSDIVVPEVCPITLEKLEHARGIHLDNSPSLDRIDNTKGYEPGNVKVISFKANSRKGNLSLEEIERLYEYIAND